MIMCFANIVIVSKNISNTQYAISCGFMAKTIGLEECIGTQRHFLSHVLKHVDREGETMFEIYGTINMCEIFSNDLLC